MQEAKIMQVDSKHPTYTQLEAAPPRNQGSPLVAPAPSTSTKASASIANEKPAEESSFTFLDFLDVINPLQHIPFVSTLYRKITGDEIKPSSSIVGNTLFGGPLGMMASLVDRLFEAGSGKDATGFMVAAITGEGNTSASAASSNTADSPIQLASNQMEALPPLPASYKRITDYEVLPWLAEKEKQPSVNIINDLA